MEPVTARALGRAMPALLLSIISPFVCGQSLEHSVTFPVSIEHDSNPKLLARQSGGVTRYRIVPSYQLTRSDGVDDWTASLAANIERSSNVAISQNRDDPSATVGWKRKGEKGEFVALASYVQASTRFTEIEDSGILLQDGTKTTRNLKGTWTTLLDERSTFAVSADYQRVTFDGGGFVAYNNRGGSATYSRAVSPLLVPFIRLSGNRYVPDDHTRPMSKSHSVVLGSQWQATETFSVTLEAGQNWIKASQDSSGWIAAVGLHQSWQRNDFAVNAGRSVAPSSTGALTEADQLKLAWAHAWDETTRVGTDLSWRKNSTQVPNTLRQYNLWVSRELSDSWQTRFYVHHKQKRQDSLPEASGTLVGFALVYTHSGF